MPGRPDPGRGLDRLLTPRRVALVGASDKPGKVGTLLWNNLAEFDGPVVPVTLGGGKVDGHPAAGSLRDLDHSPDLVVLAVPATAGPDVARDAAAVGAGALVVLAGGFAETGPEGAALQRRLVEEAWAGGVRVVGPNCFGVQNCDLRLNASIAEGLPPGGGGISLVTQSGAYGMALHTVGLEEGACFAKVVSIGNAADVGAAELLRHLHGDPATEVFCAFLESSQDGRGLAEAVRATTPRIPVVLARTGRSRAGARAARSHTAALAGRTDLWDAVVGGAGATLARSGLEMLDAARALSHQPVPRRARAAIVTNSGGTGVELVDLLATVDVDVPELSPDLRKQLVELVPAHGSTANPVDLTPVWSRFAELYPAVLTALARSGEVDVVVPILLQRAAAEPSVAIAVRDAVVALRDEGVEVAVLCCWVAARESRPNVEPLHQAGIPCFEWPERTARAVGHLTAYGRTRAHPPPLPRPLPEPDGGTAPPRDPLELSAWLEDRGIPTVATVRCTESGEAVAAARDLGRPVVVKSADPGLAHRSDRGGVRVGLDSDTEVRTAAADLLADFPDGVLVQPEMPGLEVVVGGLRDPDLGPTVMVGIGGVFVEVLSDVRFAPAPLDAGEAAALLADLQGYPLLTGARGREPVDVDGLAEVVAAVGDALVAVPRIRELDLNPVLVSAAGAVAVDWKLGLEESHPEGTTPGSGVRPAST